MLQCVLLCSASAVCPPSVIEHVIDPGVGNQSDQSDVGEHSEPHTEARWGCSCQGISEVYGVKYPSRNSLVGVPTVVLKWWFKHDCKTKPTVAATLAASGAALSSAVLPVAHHVDICTILAGPAQPWPPPILQRRAGCNTRTLGNTLSVHFMTSLVASAAGLRYTLGICRKVGPHEGVNVFWGPLIGASSPAPRLPLHVTAQALCSGPCKLSHAYPHECLESRLELALPTVRHDMQKLARGTVGAVEAADDSRTPVVHDEVVIHLRVGDIFHPKITLYGLAPWWWLGRVVANAAPRSIGIVTIAGQKSGRKEDEDFKRPSSMVLEDLVAFLHERFPATNVRVHNGAGEAANLAMSRLVLGSNHTVCAAVSTFCLWGALGSVAHGHIPASPLYGWATRVDDPLVHVEPVTILSGKMVADLKLDPDGIVQWLRQPDPQHTL